MASADYANCMISVASVISHENLVLCSYCRVVGYKAFCLIGNVSKHEAEIYPKVK